MNATRQLPRNADPDNPVELVAEAAYGALVEVGRRDLALGFLTFADDDGTPYLEPLDPDELTDDDLKVLERAERLALEVLDR